MTTVQAKLVCKLVAERLRHLQHVIPLLLETPLHEQRIDEVAELTDVYYELAKTLEGDR